ncbi:hypothetical protein CL689_03525 [Candidatus Saccharibacteria bacterium]|nr:hypothetical protein [Candidatus Saccharibacteria bacterium]|tara:strand:- start:6494 stop:6844 length:351 start_codon:yes stop_codon:yes gene_type:complete
MNTTANNSMELRFSNIPALIRGEFPNGDDLECIYIEDGKIEYYINNNMKEGIQVDVMPGLSSLVEEQFRKVFSLPVEQRQQYIKENPSFVYEDSPAASQAPSSQKPASSSKPKFGM